MEDTQVVNWEAEEEEETEKPSNSLECSLVPLGRLHIFSGAHGPEKDFPLYLGKNVVGRTPDCSVALPFPSISKQHAVIEILAWDKAPILQDCGSLNGTQILRPPKFLRPGMNHRLRDQEVLVFADLPCQYHRVDISLPFVSRGPLTIEETPRVQGGAQPWGISLAEDSEDEADLPSERCMVKGPRTTSSPLSTVVPESEEEGSSSTLDGPGPPCAFKFVSDTDEEESQQPAAGEASAATRDATTDSGQPKAVAADTQFKKDQYYLKEMNSNTRVKRDTSNRVVPVGMNVKRSQPAGEDSETDVDDESRPPGRPVEVHLKRAQPSDFIDSDTDIEEEGMPATPAIAPMKKRQIFHGVGAENPGEPDLAHLQENPAGSDTEEEEAEAQLIIPLEQTQASLVIDSDTDDEEEVLAALTLAHLKESRATTSNSNTDVKENRAQPLGFLKQSQSSPGRDSDTDMEEEGFPVEKREYVHKDHTDKAHSEKSQPPFRDSDIEVEEGKSLPGVHLERSQDSAPAGINMQVEQEVPPAPAIPLPEKHLVPVVWTSQTNVETKLPVVCPEEAQPLPDTGTPGEPTQPQRKDPQPLRESGREPHVNITRDSGDNHDALKAEKSKIRAPVDSVSDSEDLGLQATQCFVKRENESLEAAVQSMEDEPTQVFLLALPQEPGPSHSSCQAPDALDESWEVLATQPFCLRESETSETQPIAAHLEACGSYPFSPMTRPRDQHLESPVRVEPFGIQGRGMQTAEKNIGTLRESAERVTLERGPLVRETEKLPLEGLREDVMGEEQLTGIVKDREQRQVLARDTQRQGSGKVVKNSSMERNMESLKVETETLKELQEVVKEALARELFEREAEKLAPEKGSEVSIPKVILEGGTWRWEAERGSQDQKEQASSPTLESEGGAGELLGQASALIASGSQSSEGRGAPVSPSRLQRGHLNCKMPPAEKASRSDPESLDVCLHSTVPETSASVEDPLISQSQQHPAPQRHFTPSPPSSELSIPKTRQNGRQEAPENHLSSTLDPLYAKPKVRRRGSSRMTPFSVSSVGLEPNPTTFTNQPISLEPTCQATRGRTRRTSIKTPEPAVCRAPELQPSTSKDQPVTPEPTSRDSTHRSSVKTPEPVIPTASKLQTSTSKAQPISPEPTSQTTRGRKRRTSIKNPEPVFLTAPELQPSTSKDQPVSPEPTFRATRGRKHRSSLKTPEPVIPTAPELQTSTSKAQPVSPEPTYRATRGRKHRSSLKTPEPVIPTAPELQTSTSKAQPVSPEPTYRGRKRRPSIKTPEPVVLTAPELQPSTSKDQPVSPEPTSQATRGRTHRSSVETPEQAVLTAPELQPSTSKAQPVSPEPTSRATRGRKRRTSIRTPEPVVLTAPELQPSTSKDQPVSPEPTSQATRSRTHRSSVETPEQAVLTAPELQPSTSKAQPVSPEPTSRATRGRKQRTSIKTPEPVVLTTPELQPSTSKDQPVTPEPTSRGRKRRPSIKTPEPVVLTAPELQPSTSKDQPITPEPTSLATRGRKRRTSVKTPEPVVLTAPELQPTTSKDQPVTPEPTSWGRKRRPSIKTPEPVVLTAPELQPSTSKDQPVTPEPTSQATWGRTHRSFVKTHQPVKLPATATEQPVTPKAITQSGQSRTLRSARSSVPVLTTPEFQSPVPTDQPIPPEPIPQANFSRPRAMRKHGSFTAPMVFEPYSAPLEPNSQSSRNQRRGAVTVAKSLRTTPELAFAQLPEASGHVPQIQKVEAAGRCGFTPESQSMTFQNCKRPSETVGSSPLQKQLQRGEVQEEEDPAEKPGKKKDVVIPGPGKRKKEQAEEEPKGMPGRSLRRTKADHEFTAPKVLFTGVVDAQGQQAVLALGGSLASSVAEASHLVTDRVCRTVKFLCALGRGIPILSLNWLHQSRKAGCFLPPDKYVVTDPEQEKHFGFSLRVSLSRARERRLLEGYEIHVTPGVQPPPPQMGEIISCCGGIVLPSMPRSYKPRRVVITCSQDVPRCTMPLRVGLPIVSPEFLLTGVLKQEATPEAFVLSTLEMSST